MIGAIILGIVAGFAGRLVMPGRDKLGFIATFVLGLAGAVVGWLIFTDWLGIGDTQVFDLGGLLSAIIGVVILLAAFRLVRAGAVASVDTYLRYAEAAGRVESRGIPELVAGARALDSVASSPAREEVPR